MEDMTGRRFERLTVVGFSHKVKRLSLWHCQCDCGGTAIVYRSNLVKGNSKSCGCFYKERVKEINRRHGQSYNPIYISWAGMKARCTNPNEPSFVNYGGRGIVLSERWLSFDNFYADMHSGWKPGLTIERINNDGNYEPSNCRWATRKEQARNSRRTVLIDTPQGRMHVEDAAKLFGLKAGTLKSRIIRGMPQDRWFDPPGPQSGR